MADYNNRQLAEIISQVSEKINSNVLKERKIANDLEKTSKNIEFHIEFLKEQILELKETSIKPDLSNLNKFYEEKTAENIKRLNSRLKVPNLAIYIWVIYMLLFLCSGIFIFLSVQSKQEIISEYESKLNKEGKVIMLKGNKELFEEMDTWFGKNPKAKQNFIDWRNSQTK